MPQSNKAINKYLREDTARQDYIQLINDEFNDARTQVIKKLFDQTALYNDKDYKERPSKENRIGDTMVEFNIQALINDLKNEIDTASGKLNADEKRLVGKIDVQDKFNKVISAITAYANTTSADPENIKSFKSSLAFLSPNLKKLLYTIQSKLAIILEFLAGVDSGLINPNPPGRPDLAVDIDQVRKDRDQIARYFVLFAYLYERLESGYNQGQEFELRNLASLDIPNDKLDEEVLKVINMLQSFPVPNLVPDSSIPIIQPPGTIPVVARGKNKKQGTLRTLYDTLEEYLHQTPRHGLRLVNPSSRVNVRTEANGRVNVRTEANGHVTSFPATSLKADGKKKAKKRCKPDYEDI